MNDTVSLFEELSTGFQDLASQVIVYLPRVIAAVLVLVVGWLLARALSLLLVRAISQLEELWHRLISKRGLASVQTRRPPTRVVGELVFWLLMFVIVIMAWVTKVPHIHLDWAASGPKNSFSIDVD